MIEITNEVIGVFVLGFCFALLFTLNFVNRYIHLVEWLKDQAPMTWDTYKRLGK